MKPKPILNYKDSYNMHVINSYRFQEPWVNTGKYTYAELVDMIGVQGYIPVASFNELNALRNSTIQEMGAGTPFEATYLTGTDKRYVQLNNIDFESSIYVVFNFAGIYDGNNLLISAVNTSDKTVFGSATSSSIIKNCNIQGDFVYLSNDKGPFGGNFYGTLLNCSFQGFVSGNQFIGGLVGRLKTGAKILNSSVNVTIQGISSLLGGLSGVFEGNTEVINCFALVAINSNLTALGSIGGLAGFNYGSIIKSHSQGTIYLSNIYYSGGIVGRNYGTIEDCHTSVSIEGSGLRTGGAIGSNEAGSTVLNCYSVGLVQGSSEVGGFCGANYGTITNSYWDTDTSGKPTSSGGTGKTTAEMKAGLIPDTTIYIGWDPLIWDPGTVNDYPSLIGV